MKVSFRPIADIRATYLCVLRDLFKRQPFRELEADKDERRWEVQLKKVATSRHKAETEGRRPAKPLDQ